MKTQRTVQVGSESLSLETGHIAKQAHGACVVRLGDTVVLTTACMQASTLPRDFLPLTVDYREYAYAAGRIPGGFFKREGRSTEKETITARMIDRPLRPLFPPGYTAETQIISFVLSADGEHDPDILAINGASTALVLSEIPFYNPIAAVRVGLIDGQVVFNPTNSQRDVADLDLVVVGSEAAVMMVEAGANQLSEQTLLDCIWAGHAELQKVIQAQISMFRERGLSKPAWTAPEAYPQELYNEVRGAIHSQLKAALHTQGKFERKDAVSTVVKGYLGTIPEDNPTKRSAAKKVIETLEEETLYDSVLNDRNRFDSRKLDEIRAIDIEVGVLPRTHGSALFTRGETQALATVTLGTQRDAQIIEEYEGESKQKFLLHYNFPPFSVGEVKFLRGASRREIGHGVLARRALLPVLPNEEDFPYTIRVVSDILESNGSSSMATVCGGSLALFDAGVPLLAPVAGVAMGLVQRGDNFAVLTDIAGQEDHYGDMDFKVAGTRKGITALQMDIKVGGVSKSVMETALEQARIGRLHILGKMEAIIGTPRVDLSDFAPRLYTIQINKEKIRDIIGPGGKTIRSIVEETGCQVEVENDGRVIIASPNAEAAKRAIQMVERLTQVPEIGKIYTGSVRRVEAYGCFVEIMPGTDGLVHISELAPYRVRETSDVVKEGDELTVKVIDIDDTGRVRLSRKAVIVEAPDYDPAQYAGMGMSEDERPPRADGPPAGRGGDRGGRGGRPERGGRSGGGGRDSRGPRR
ncbi:MAG: polyribonucleotide nucleotidyltransferase [Thermoanaerobaculia bacterium]|jgi:polyribonucleotide nucleotidyltransferase|nr:polyribonucleotide nucleotidyltransferase [Thermoanaerobaculia bacterium]MBP9823277.1 polyribonucleotide nucleotidyltransferase [Thermoanaerobaculia bacterium]